MKKTQILLIFLTLIIITLGIYLGLNNLRNQGKTTVYFAQPGQNVSYEVVEGASQCTGMEGFKVIDVNQDQATMESILQTLRNDYMKPKESEKEFYAEKYDSMKVLGYERVNDLAYINLSDKEGYFGGGSARGNYFRCMFIETVKKNDSAIKKVEFKLDGNLVDSKNYFIFQP